MTRLVWSQCQLSFRNNKILIPTSVLADNRLSSSDSLNTKNPMLLTKQFSGLQAQDLKDPGTQ